jgi:molybdate transport system substrate-binding protein
MKSACFCLLALFFLAAPLRAAEIRIAAAADLRFAMVEIVSLFKKRYPNDNVEVAYGSSGKFHTQIQNGAPYDLFFSADIALPEKLAQAGLAASAVQPYALGRIVIWRPRLEGAPLMLADLGRPEIRRIAIANPRHAPYGMRAVEALKAAQVWPAVENRLVYGENIAQTAQFVQTGNADAGIIALSLAVAPEFVEKGQYSLIPVDLHQPLLQGFVILKRAEGKVLARRFADFFAEPGVQGIMSRYGFALPDAPSG